jgi:hypothetical protein
MSQKERLNDHQELRKMKKISRRDAEDNIGKKFRQDLQNEQDGRKESLST